jgi:hypothetical protein
MLRIVAKLFAMCILPTPVNSANVTSNCTILEWNVGVYGFFSEDQAQFGKANGVFDVIRTIVFFDLDFQSTWNTTLKARWGPSWYVRSIEMNPCLRLRPIIIDAPDDLKTEYMKAQVNSFWTFNDIDVDVLAYMPEVPAENILHSGTQGKVSVGMLESAVLENKQLYPYLFRYANPSGDDARVAYQYYVHFAWRSITLVHDESADGGAKFQVFFGLWTSNNHSTKSMNIHTVPSSSLPYQKAAVQAMIDMIKASTTRLLYLDVGVGWNFATDPHCQPFSLNVCVLRDLLDANVRAPHFQYLVSESTVDSLEFMGNSHNVPGYNYTLVYFQNMHYTGGFALRLDQVNVGDVYNTVIKQGITLQPSDYVNAYTRYGISEWSQDTWKSFWEERVLRGEALVGFGMNPEILAYMFWLGDVLAFILFALNNVMNTYQPTSKAQITTKMMADAMSISSPTYTAYNGVSAPFTMPYPGQKVLSTSVVKGRNVCLPYPSDDCTTNNKITDYPICCNGTYSRGGVTVYNDSEARWSTGSTSWTPPPALLNCTPGQYFNADGLCEWCPAGRFSGTFDQTACGLCPRGQRSAAKSVACEECAVGRVASELQSENCADCIGGTYASMKGRSQCIYCEFGKYSDAIAATVCNECGGDLITASKGSLSVADCICSRGTFSRDFHVPNKSSSKGTSCETCMEGLDCETNWPSSWNAVGDPTSIALPGFYTLVSAPYETYKCCFGEACEQDCPGGAPACNPDRTGLVCDACVDDGYFIKEATCQRCPFYMKLLLPMFVIVTSILCCAAYYGSNGPLTVDADNPLATVLFFGLVVTSAQIFGIVKDMEIPWPESIHGFMSGSSAVFALDGSGIPFECAVGTWPVALYMVQVLFPYLLLTEIFALFAGSKLIARVLQKPSISWQTDKMLNVAGQVMQLLFIAFCGIMVKPMQCFRHPNGKRSLKMYPRLLCGEGGDHSGLLLLAAIICFGFILPFVTWCTWGCIKAPSESSNANSGFLRRFRFLLYRFRPDCWWWGLCFMLRQTILAFVTVLVIENPHGQLFYTGGALAVYGFLVCRYWPWISGELSFVDAGAMLVLVLIMLTAAQFLPEPTPNKGRFGILVALFFSMGALLTRYLLLIGRSMLANGIFGEFGNGNPDRITTSKDWLQWLEYMENLPNSEIIETVCKMNGFDRQSIISLMSSWNAITKEGVGVKQKRLVGVPNKVVVSRERTSQLCRQSSRISTSSRQSTRTSTSKEAKEAFVTSRQDSIDVGHDNMEDHNSAVVEDPTGTESEMCMV